MAVLTLPLLTEATVERKSNGRTDAIKDHTLFKKNVDSCIKTDRNQQRRRRQGRKISNGNGSLGQQHLLQLYRPLLALSRYEK